MPVITDWHMTAVLNTERGSRVRAVAAEEIIIRVVENGFAHIVPSGGEGLSDRPAVSEPALTALLSSNPADQQTQTRQL